MSKGEENATFSGFSRDAERESSVSPDANLAKAHAEAHVVATDPVGHLMKAISAARAAGQDELAAALAKTLVEHLEKPAGAVVALVKGRK